MRRIDIPLTISFREKTFKECIKCQNNQGEPLFPFTYQHWLKYTIKVRDFQKNATESLKVLTSGSQWSPRKIKVEMSDVSFLLKKIAKLTVLHILASYTKCSSMTTLLHHQVTFTPGSEMLDQATTSNEKSTQTRRYVRFGLPHSKIRCSFDAT